MIDVVVSETMKACLVHDDAVTGKIREFRVCTGTGRTFLVFCDGRLQTSELRLPRSLVAEIENAIVLLVVPVCGASTSGAYVADLVLTNDAVEVAA